MGAKIEIFLIFVIDMRMFRLLLLAVTALLACSCASRFDEVEFTSVRLVSVAPEGLTGLSVLLEVGIHNPAVAFSITGMQAVVKSSGREAVILESDQLLVDGRSDRCYMVPLKGAIAEGFNPFSLLSLLDGADLSGFTLSVRARLALRSGLGKVIEFNDIPVSELLDDTVL